MGEKYKIACDFSVVDVDGEKRCRCKNCDADYPCPRGSLKAACKAKKGTPEWIAAHRAQLDARKLVEENYTEAIAYSSKLANVIGQSQKAYTEQPSAMQRALNFADAFKRWVAAGRPRRTPEEIKNLYDNECKLCPFFNEKKQTCGHSSCGCNLSDKDEFLNKLAWATESCPINKF